MKELSIREKAERYDKISKEVKDFFDGKQKMYSDVEQTLNYLFPELRGPEDERIKEDLIEWIDEFPDTIWRGHYKKDVIAWLEKQGEQESIDPDALIQQRVDALADIVAEQNSTDELKPKFHEGDWITNGDYTWKIVKVKPLDYILQSQDGNIVEDTISHVDEHFHSFTIQDAKEGDVLALSYAFQNYILIYKGLHEKDFDTMMSVFCSYYVEENTYEDETDSFHAMNRGEIITPATKKQRDILIKAMNDAGYTFDFEKKELKEMEQEQDSINPSEYINDMGGNGCYLKNTAQVSAWSEEDEKMVNDIIAAIDTLYYHGMVNWLKSLKERYTWKPSEEQIIALNNAVLLNEDHYNGAVLSTLLEQLKKL